MFSDLTKIEKQVFKSLETPVKIQNFLDKIPINFEKKGETCLSPREVLRQNKAHCVEGAMLAAAIFWFHGQRPWLLDLKTGSGDFDHVVALFKANGLWGAISKSNHAVLLYRDPIFRTVRELALSYFHEYFLDNGRKTMISFSRAFSLARYGKKWITSKENLWDVSADLDDVKHYKVFKKGFKPRIADKIAIKAGKLTVWK